MTPERETEIRQLVEKNHRSRSIGPWSIIPKPVEAYACEDLLQTLDACRAENKRLREGLVVMYRQQPALVARVCDEVIDQSGALLGHIRKGSEGEG